MEHPVWLHRGHKAVYRAGRSRRPAPFVYRRRARIDLRAVWLMIVIGVACGLAAAEFSWPGETIPPRALASQQGAPAISAKFGLCHVGGGTNCVVDGDTFWVGGEKVRIAGIDAPETHPPRCAEEARLGAAATRRLQELLNAGPFVLVPIDRDSDVYGRKLRNVERDGRSLGDAMIAEGLVRPYGGGRQPWC